MKVNLTNYNHAVHKVKHKARHALVDKREHKTTTPYIRNTLNNYVERNSDDIHFFRASA